jgi:putative membrane protein
MKLKYSTLALLLTLCLAGFTTACQRNEGAKAASEEGYAPANPDADKTLSGFERELSMKIQKGHLAEIDAATTAKGRASHKDVKDYAEMLADDHSSALDNIRDIMKDKNAADAISEQRPEEAAAMMAKLQTLSGAAFDKQYLVDMVDKHAKTLADLQNATGSLQNRDMKDYVNGLTRKVQHHLEEAQELQTRLKY